MVWQNGSGVEWSGGGMMRFGMISVVGVGGGGCLKVKVGILGDEFSWGRRCSGVGLWKKRLL